MGFTGLARWVNAPTTGIELVNENIMRNHRGQYRGRWQLSVRSYRSTFGAIPGFSFQAERFMCALTMNDNVFVLLEDPSAPQRADIATTWNTTPNVQGPTHYRTTFLTLKPPGALEGLLSQLKARWASVRQSSTNARGPAAGQQLLIEGNIFAIGTDWLVRAGKVTLAGGAMKGMLLEAEYLPVPVLQSQTADGTSELLSNLLTSILPNIRDAKTVAVTIGDQQWKEVEEEDADEQETEKGEDIMNDIYVSGDEEMPMKQKGDWVGVDRDRRSAYLIIGALKMEGIL